MPEAAPLEYGGIKVGDVHEFERMITKEDVAKFAELSGDFNPLHVDGPFAKKTKFGRNVVHGMLLASLFSQLVGMHCPGRNCLYLSQTLDFRKPAFYGDRVTVRGTVQSKADSIRVITIRTQVLRGNEVLAEGTAKAGVLQ